MSHLAAVDCAHLGAEIVITNEKTARAERKKNASVLVAEVQGGEPSRSARPLSVR